MQGIETGIYATARAALVTMLDRHKQGSETGTCTGARPSHTRERDPSHTRERPGALRPEQLVRRAPRPYLPPRRPLPARRRAAGPAAVLPLCFRIERSGPPDGGRAISIISHYYFVFRDARELGVKHIKGFARDSDQPFCAI